MATGNQNERSLPAEGGRRLQCGVAGRVDDPGVKEKQSGHPDREDDAEKAEEAWARLEGSEGGGIGGRSH